MNGFMKSIKAPPVSFFYFPVKVAESPTFLLSKGKNIAAGKDSNAEHEMKAGKV